MRKVLRGLAAAALVLGFTSAASAVPITITIDLLPSLEVPPVSSPASGTATVEFSDALDSLTFSLSMDTINTPLLQAHIHIASPAANGPIALFLFDLCSLLTGCGPGDLRIFGDNVVLEGTATAADLRGGFSFQDILDAASANGAYINVHTENNGPGEIRGQIATRPEPSSIVPTIIPILIPDDD